MRQKVITGHWDGERIWRWETPEETLKREQVSVEASNLYIALDRFSKNALHLFKKKVSTRN